MVFATRESKTCFGKQERKTVARVRAHKAHARQTRATLETLRVQAARSLSSKIVDAERARILQTSATCTFKAPPSRHTAFCFCFETFLQPRYGLINVGAFRFENGFKNFWKFMTSGKTPHSKISVVPRTSEIHNIQEKPDIRNNQGIRRFQNIQKIRKTGHSKNSRVHGNLEFPMLSGGKATFEKFDHTFVVSCDIQSHLAATFVIIQLRQAYSTATLVVV